MSCQVGGHSIRKCGRMMNETQPQRTPHSFISVQRNSAARLETIRDFTPNLDIMTLSCSFPAEDAKKAIEQEGIYVLQDPEVGSRVNEFRNSGFPTKSPLGLEFVAQNSLYREVTRPNSLLLWIIRLNVIQDISTIFRSILIRPQWGLVKIYSDILSSDYAFRFHNGSDERTHTLLVQLWGPKTTVDFYHGSHTQKIEEFDEDMSKKWGLLATRRDHMRRDGAAENTVKMEFGGL
jgi:hypothetical protein